MISWWRDLKLSSKLGLCGLCFLVPLALLLFLLLGQMAKDIRLTKVELAGIEAMDPLEDLTELVADHLQLTLLGFAGQDVTSRREQLRVSSREYMRSLGARLTGDARLLGLTPERLEPMGLAHLAPHAFLAKLDSLMRQSPATPRQAIDQHAAFQALLAEMRDYLADSAQLVLDPDLSSYYLMYLLIFDIPRAQERLGMLAAYGCENLGGLGGPDVETARIEFTAVAWEQTVVERILDKIAKARRALGNDSLAALPPAVQAYADSCRTFLELSKAIAKKENKATLEQYSQAATQARAAGATLWDRCDAIFKDLLDARASGLKLRMGVAVGVSLAAIVLTALLAWTVVTSITRPLARVARIATSIAEGKVAQASRMLEQACPSGSCTRERILAGSRSRSETNQLFSAVAVMIHGLEELLTAVGQTGERLQASSSRIAATARQLEAAATQQAASTVEVGATSKEISATARELSETMTGALTVANRSSELASQGRESLALMGQAMEDLSGASREMAGKLSLIREKASGIGQLLTTIGKVAAQTNLLSLNAAIEAEKAGEFGPGFAVVAREIRRLADQTAAAALDIERTVRDMQASVQAGGAAMDGFTAMTLQAADTSRGVNVKLGRIIEAGEELTPRVHSATDGMRLQAEGADQISVVITQLADNAGQTRDSLAEFRQAAEDLTATAAGLKDLLVRFETGR